MIKNTIYLFSAVILCFVESYSFADVQSTREVLGYFSANDPKILKSYDHLAKAWVEYQTSNPKQFDLNKLLKAIEFAAEKQARQVQEDTEISYILSSMGTSEVLWNISSSRNVNILISALLKDTLKSNHATEQEIATLFGSRVLYIVQEITNDSTQENDLSKIYEMSLDGQLIKLAEALYTAKELYSLPAGPTEQQIEVSYVWAEELLSALRGTINSNLENTLQVQIEDYKNKIIGQHIVVDHRKRFHMSSWDDENYWSSKVAGYAVILDNGTEWWVDPALYESKNLLRGWEENKEIEIRPYKDRSFPLGDNNRYVMVIHENGESSKNILFIKQDSRTFEANIHDHKIDIIGPHIITNVYQDEKRVYFSLENDDRVWEIERDVYNAKKMSIENGLEVEIDIETFPTMAPKLYWVTFPEKNTTFVFMWNYGRKGEADYTSHVAENREYFGLQKVTNVVTLKRTISYRITFNFAGRTWDVSSDQMHPANRIEDGDEAKARPLADGRYEVTFPAKWGPFYGNLGYPSTE